MIEVASVVLRWLQFAGAVVLFGVALFRLYSPPLNAEPSLRRLVFAGGLTLLIAAPLGLIAQTVIMAGSMEQALDPAALDYVIRHTPLGLAHAARTALAVGVVVLLLSPLRDRLLWGLVALLGLAVCASFAWSGHAGATTGAMGPMHLAADVIHTTAAGAWLGALAAFVTMARRRALDTPALHRSLARFAGVGTAAVVLLAGSGLVNAYVLVGPQNVLSALETPYGLLLGFKIVLFALMLGLAANHRFVLSPALRAPDASSERDTLRRLRQSLWLETNFGAALLAVVAVMGTLAPPAAL